MLPRGRRRGRLLAVAARSQERLHLLGDESGCPLGRQAVEEVEELRRDAAIAATAGVNLALINRYFGSKENLFLETMQVPTMESLFGDDPTRMAEHAAHFAAAYHAAGPNQ